jgi:hypothetical protein
MSGDSIFLLGSGMDCLSFDDALAALKELIK